MAPKRFVWIKISGIVNVISFGKRISVNELKDLGMRSSWIFRLGSISNDRCPENGHTERRDT